MKTYYKAQETLVKALWRPESDGRPKGRGYMSLDG